MAGIRIEGNTSGNVAEVTVGNAIKVDASATTQPVSGAVTITGTPAVTATDNLTQVGGSAISLGSKTSANSLPVVIASDQGILPVSGAATTTPPVYTTGTNNPLSLDLAGGIRTTISDRSVAVSLTAVSQTAVIAMEGRLGVAFNLTSMGTGGQVAVEFSIDGITWINVDSWQESTEAWVSNVVTVADSYWCEPLGSTAFCRLRCVAITSGTITGTLLANMGLPGTFEYQTGLGQLAPPNAIYIAGNATSTAPSYANNLTGGLSMNLAGGLRVDGSGVTQPISGAVAISGTPAVSVVQTASLPSDAVNELLLKILIELKQLNLNLRQMPTHLNRGIEMLDEDQIFRDDPTVLMN